MTADARSAHRVEGGRISGDMLWFNNEKGHGFIETAAGDRLRVEGSGFRNGPPEGRCAGMPVTFHVAVTEKRREPSTSHFRRTPRLGAPASAAAPAAELARVRLTGA